MAHQSLPSPAPSDDNLASPHIGLFPRPQHSFEPTPHPPPLGPTDMPSQLSPPQPSRLSLGVPGIPFDRSVLRQQLDQAMTLHQQRHQPEAHHLTGTGRLTLLIQAVVEDDLFYLVLSQLVCLRSVHPSDLPPAFADIPQQYFTTLEAMLASNHNLSPVLLKFCAVFPLPINIFCANSPMKDLYDSVVQSVSRFMHLLGARWGAIKAASITRQAPPLAKEMKEQLALYSPCLRLVVYRAICRELLRNSRNTNAGVEALETIHQLEQDLTKQGMVWDGDTVRRACEAIKMLLHHFREWDWHQVEKVPHFEIPRQVVTMFMGKTAFPTPPINANPPTNPVLRNPPTTRRPSQTIPHSLRILLPSQHHGQTHIPTQHRGQRPRRAQQHVQTPRHAQQPTMQPPEAPKDVRFFFPRHGALAPPIPTEPETSRIALHQAHLRSPEMGVRGRVIPSQQLYRQVDGFAFWPPQKLNPSSIQQRITFVVSSEEYTRLAKSWALDSPERVPQRPLNEDLLTWRLRCASPKPSNTLNTSVWLESDSVWPDDTYFCIGEPLQHLEPRKKLHHGKHLPIDLTPYIREGPNTLTVIFNRHSFNLGKPFDYTIAVETVKVFSHQSILDNITHIDHQTSLGQIRSSISGPGPSANANDELMILSTSLTLNVRNPATLLIYDIPVRSSRCKHHDCFDLASFLQLAKRDDPSWPSHADTWRCPICRCDARPSLLLQDGFFMQVREELTRRNELDVEAIIVEANGEWRSKPRVATTGVRSASLEREEAELAGNGASAKVARVIIELNDD